MIDYLRRCATLGLPLLILTCLPVPSARADTITITNIGEFDLLGVQKMPHLEARITDLFYWDYGDVVHTILTENDPPIVIAPNATYSVDTAFDAPPVKKVAVSLDKMEFVVDVAVIPFHVMWDPLYFSSTLSNTPLMGLVDQEIPFLGFRVPVGTTFDFVGGHNEFFPGFFLGNSFDFATGAVSDPFTGSATVRSSTLRLAVHPVPEPSTLVMLTMGLLGWPLARLASSRRNRGPRPSERG